MTVDPGGPFVAAPNHRILLVADDGHVSRALGAGLERGGCSVSRASPGDEDLFEKAVGHDTIVHLPAESLLRAPDGEVGASTGVHEVLAAGSAPGVQLLLAVLPAGTRAALAEEDAIARSGIPYFIVRTPTLVEELEAELPGEVPETVWAPACAGIALGDVETLVRAVLDCLTDEQQGRVIELRPTVNDVPTALRRALAPDRHRVIPVWPPIFQMGRVAARIMRGEDTADVRLIDALLARREAPAPAPRPAA